jgi:hypothetical protein
LWQYTDVPEVVFNEETPSPGQEQQPLNARSNMDIFDWKLDA